MLLAIRERVMGVVGWVLLALLFIAFSFFGLNWYFQSDVRAYAAKVNGVDIPIPEQQRAYQNLRTRLQNMMGENYNPALIDETALRNNALEQLIREQLLLQQAEADGYSVSKQLVAAQVNAIQSFRENGSFSREMYERTLRNQGMSPAEFEWRLSREIMTNQIINGIAQTAGVTPEELALAYRLQAQQRRFSYLRLPLTRVMDQVEVSDSDIEQYYEAHGSEFMTPERIRIQYIELRAADLQTIAEADEAALRALYEEHGERYVTPEERRARHILISLAADADEETAAGAQQKTDSILQRLEQGESFEALASELSDDPGSAGNGGDLGFFGKGIMTPEFEQAVFALEKGARSEVVRSPFGLHIIELTDIKPEVARPFEEVRDELMQEYHAAEREDLFYDKSELLTNLVFEQPDSLQGAADALEIEVMTSDWLTRDGGPEIGENPEVVAAAFMVEVLENGNNSEPVELEEDHLVVVRIQDHEEASRKPLDSIRDEVARRVHEEKARELVRNEGERLLNDLKSGTTLAGIATAESLEVQETGLLNRRAESPDRALINAAYLLPPPGSAMPPVTGFALDSGDFVLVVLEEIRDGDVSELPEADRQRARQELGRIQGASQLAALLQELRSRATIITPEASE